MNVAFGEPKDSSHGRQAAESNRLPYEAVTLAVYAIFLARTGGGAIKSTKEHAADVVLLEIELIDMEGIDVVKAIRENPIRAGRLIIAISAFPYMNARCLDSVSDGFIQKPIKALDLLTQLRKLTKVEVNGIAV